MGNIRMLARHPISSSTLPTERQRSVPAKDQRLLTWMVQNATGKELSFNQRFNSKLYGFRCITHFIGLFRVQKNTKKEIGGKNNENKRRLVSLLMALVFVCCLIGMSLFSFGQSASAAAPEMIKSNTTQEKMDDFPTGKTNTGEIDPDFW